MGMKHTDVSSGTPFATNSIPFVLIADDDDLLAQLIEHTLIKEGYRVKCVGDGEQALAEISAAPPDLVILDGMMPGMDGFDVLRRLSETPNTADLPVIMLTARGMARDVVAGLELGADDYLVKPFMPEELIARIKKVLRA